MKLALGRALYDPGDPMGKLFFNILATFAEFEADLIRMRTREGMATARARGKLRGKQPKLSDSSGNSAACMPRASIPSAISPNSAPSQDQPSIAHSTGAFPLSVRSCPLPESTRGISPLADAGMKALDAMACGRGKRDEGVRAVGQMKLRRTGSFGLPDTGTISEGT